MANSHDIALWEAVAAIQSSYHDSVRAANEADIDPRPVFSPSAEALAAVDTALAAGADPNRPLTFDEFNLWNQDKVISAAQLMYPPPDIYNPEHRGIKTMTYDEYKDWKKANAADSGVKVPAALSREEYSDWYEDKTSSMCFYVLLNALEVPDVLNKLLAAGADPNVCDSLYTGDYALHTLVRDYYFYDQPAVTMRALLAAGADVDARNRDGQTPLQVGCWDKRLGGLLNILLEHGASATAVDDDGNTALHAAAFHDEGYKQWPLDESEELRSDPYENECGERSEDSRLWGAREAVNALVDAGADPNAVNTQNGYTPMHWASVHHGHAYLEFLEALFERGGRVDIPNHAGLRPLDFWADDENEPEARKLRERFRNSLKQR